MSGTMMPQSGGAPQMNPQMMMALLAAAQQRGGGGMGMPQRPMTGPVPGAAAPPGQPAGSLAPQAGGQPVAPAGGAQPMSAPQPLSNMPSAMQTPPPVGAPQNVAMFGRAATGQPMQAGQNMRLNSAEAAHMGRFGDSVMAHLTPGEIAVPHEVQTPEVMKVLTQAFQRMGVSPQMFTAGSAQSSVNPATGAPEYSILGALLPVLGAVAGSVIAPGIGTAIGGGLGGLAGGLMNGGGALGGILGGLGGAAGGYLGDGAPGLGSLLGSGAASAGGGAAGAATDAATGAATTAPFGAVAGNAPLSAAGNSALNPQGGLLSQLGQYIKPAMYAGIGSSLGQAAGPQPVQGPQYPPGFNTPMTPLNPNFGQLSGSHVASTPTFNNYNPYTAVTGQPFTFYPVQ